ncbi:hypothetical protein [Staphylococcus pseudintermedius]|uniref:hypothetical protein n=1 Tax=Staphylococcus pseudintermedius TaxID=283734 RepID=UPI000CE3B724|nr:hypothetical protein [Staphylococcus pseudintermedius]EGQ0356635.1 hypothetical protein [Staphylococcus pseudintermedius]EGQ3970041.1 hypothetical protein [Staphylococcus pseudintermedius]EHV5260387.1 hypothetical protein [Staphylococcus pseudintermedius]EJL8254427.1 hypothetical protein [Staphylococcus pseudintermedius]MDK3624609.1 hypothetical protein [Staphylococcus pseudintermedius]
MEIPNSDIEIRPMLSNLQFYIGQTGKPEHDPLLDFSLLYEDAELGMRFTLSGLDKINNPFSDKNELHLMILLYDKVGGVGFDLRNFWTLKLNGETMRKSYETVQFTLYKFEPNNRNYDFTNIYQQLKILALPKEIDEQSIEKETFMNWMAMPQQNEILSTKIPIYHQKEINND